MRNLGKLCALMICLLFMSACRNIHHWYRPKTVDNDIKESFVDEGELISDLSQLPADIPLPMNVTDVHYVTDKQGRSTISFTSSMSDFEAHQFYRQEMVWMGWRMCQELGAHEAALLYEKPQLNCVILFERLHAQDLRVKFLRSTIYDQR